MPFPLRLLSPFLSPARPFRPSNPLASPRSPPSRRVAPSQSGFPSTRPSSLSSVLRLPMRLLVRGSLSSPASLRHSTSLSLARSLSRLSLSLSLLSFFSHRFGYTSSLLPLSPTPLNHYISLSFSLPFFLSVSHVALFLRDRIVYVLRAGIAARNCPSHSDAVCSLPFPSLLFSSLLFPSRA